MIQSVRGSSNTVNPRQVVTEILQTSLGEAVFTYVKSGLDFTPNFEDSMLDVSSGEAYILNGDGGVYLRPESSTLELQNGLNRIYLVDPLSKHEVGYEVRTDDTSPVSPSVQIGWVDTNSETYDQDINRGGSLQTDSLDVQESNHAGDQLGETTDPVIELFLEQLNGPLVGDDALSSLVNGNLTVDENGNLTAPEQSQQEFTETDHSGDTLGSTDPVQQILLNSLSGPITNSDVLTSLVSGNLSIDDDGNLQAPETAQTTADTDHSNETIGSQTDPVTKIFLELLDGSITGGDELSSLVGDNLSINASGELEATDTDTQSRAFPGYEMQVQGEKGGSVSSGDQGNVVTDHLADGETLEISKATFLLTEGRPSPANFNLIIATLDNQGGFTEREIIHSGDGNTVYDGRDNSVGSPLVSWTNDTGSGSTVAILIDNQTGSTQDVETRVYGEKL